MLEYAILKAKLESGFISQSDYEIEMQLKELDFQYNLGYINDKEYDKKYVKIMKGKGL